MMKPWFVRLFGWLFCCGSALIALVWLMAAVIGSDRHAPQATKAGMGLLLLGTPIYFVLTGFCLVVWLIGSMVAWMTHQAEAAGGSVSDGGHRAAYHNCTSGQRAAWRCRHRGQWRAEEDCADQPARLGLVTVRGSERSGMKLTVTELGTHVNSNPSSLNSAIFSISRRRACKARTNQRRPR